MQRCPACTNKNVPEKIIHWIVSRIIAEIISHAIEKENFVVRHFMQNSVEDKQGKDLGIFVGKKGYFIQVKGYREIRPTDIKKRVMILERRFRNFANDTKKFKRYIYTVVNRYKRLKLLKNDEEIRERFRKFAQTTLFFKKLNEEKNFQKILELFIGVEHFINIFEAAIIHSDRYPSVKLFFIVDLTNGIDRQKRTATLTEECTRLIKQALKNQGA